MSEIEACTDPSANLAIPTALTNTVVLHQTPPGLRQPIKFTYQNKERELSAPNLSKATRNELATMASPLLAMDQIVGEEIDMYQGKVNQRTAVRSLLNYVTNDINRDRETFGVSFQELTHNLHMPIVTEFVSADDYLCFLSGEASLSILSTDPLPIFDPKGEFASKTTKETLEELKLNNDTLQADFNTYAQARLAYEKGSFLFNKLPKEGASPEALFDSDGAELLPSYPALNILIEDKVETDCFNIGRMIAYLYAVTASYARHAHVNTPLSTFGLLTDGIDYQFIGYQLNNLDVSFRAENAVRNTAFLMEEMPLVELVSGQPKARSDTYETIHKVLSLLYRSGIASDM